MPLISQGPAQRVILGTMTFGPDTSTGARVTSLDEYKKVLDDFQAAGYNEIDTARFYVGTKQEDWTTQAGWQQRGLKLATKHYPQPAGEHSRQNIRKALETSLKELNTKCVDIYYLHAADRSVPFEETLAELDAMHKEGKFVQLGLSNFVAFEVAEVVMICRAHGWVRPTVYQGVYNAITRSLETEVIPACKRYGIEVVVYNPIAGGLFSGKIKTAEIPKEGRYSDTVGAMGARYRERYFKDATFDALARIEPAAAKHNITMIEVALRWLKHHSKLEIANGGPDGVIIGISNHGQLAGNLDALSKGPLPDDVVSALDEAWAIAKADTPPYWHLDLAYTYDTRKALFG